MMLLFFFFLHVWLYWMWFSCPWDGCILLMYLSLSVKLNASTTITTPSPLLLSTLSLTFFSQHSFCLFFFLYFLVSAKLQSFFFCSQLQKSLHRFYLLIIYIYNNNNNNTNSWRIIKSSLSLSLSFFLFSLFCGSLTT